MPVFFVPPSQIAEGGLVRILDRDAHHISRVLRWQRGEIVTVVAGEGLEHDIRLETVHPDQVSGVIVASRLIRREPKTELHLIQALPKGSGMAQVCEQASELGVTSLWPVTTERTIPRLDPGTVSDKVRRWQAIAQEAAQLSGRHRVPTVHQVTSAAEALAQLSQASPGLQAFACHGDELREGLGTVAWDKEVPTVILVGPEGGFGPGEIQQLASLGARTVSLGPLNLRSTLAGVIALTILLSRAGDLEAPAG